MNHDALRKSICNFHIHVANVAEDTKQENISINKIIFLCCLVKTCCMDIHNEVIHIKYGTNDLLCTSTELSGSGTS